MFWENYVHAAVRVNKYAIYIICILIYTIHTHGKTTLFIVQDTIL